MQPSAKPSGKEEAKGSEVNISATPKVSTATEPGLLHRQRQQEAQELARRATQNRIDGGDFRLENTDTFAQTPNPLPNAGPHQAGNAAQAPGPPKKRWGKGAATKAHDQQSSPVSINFFGEHSTSKSTPPWQPAPLSENERLQKQLEACI